MPKKGKSKKQDRSETHEVKARAEGEPRVQALKKTEVDKLHKLVRAVNDSVARSATKGRNMLMVNVDEKGQPTAVELKDGAVPRPLGAEREFAKTILGLRPIKVQLIQEFSFTQPSAAAALNSVFPADLALASDISSWIALFDEMRMDSLEFMFHVFMQWSGSVASPIIPMSAAFDPDQSGAATSHSVNLKATKHLGPCLPFLSNGVSGATGQIMGGPLNASQKGHYLLGSGKLMRSVLPGSSGGVIAPNPVQGAWVPTTTATAVGGYLKLWGQAPGASLTWGTYCWVRFNAEFRMRG